MKYVALTSFEEEIWIMIFSTNEFHLQVTAEGEKYYSGKSLEDILLISSSEQVIFTNSFTDVLETDMFDNLNDAFHHIIKTIKHNNIEKEVIQTLFSGYR